MGTHSQCAAALPWGHTILTGLPRERESARNPHNPTTHTLTHTTFYIQTNVYQLPLLNKCIPFQCAFKRIRVTQDVIT